MDARHVIAHSQKNAPRKKKTYASNWKIRDTLKNFGKPWKKSKKIQKKIKQTKFRKPWKTFPWPGENNLEFQVFLGFSWFSWNFFGLQWAHQRI